MTRLDWRKKPEIDPARMQRESLSTNQFDEEVIARSGRKPRRVVPTPKCPKGPRLSFNEAVRKMPSFRKNLGSRIRFLELAGKTDCDEIIQETALLISAHAEQTGDCGRALALAKAVASSRRAGQLVSWFRETGPIRINLARGRVGLSKPDKGDFCAFDMDLARRKPFFEY